MYQRLQQCAKIPDFNNYLAFILTQGEGTQDEIRQTAGLLLKNNLKTGWQSTEPAHQAYIQRALLPALGHPNRFLRHTVGTALSMITRAVGPRGWPGLYTTLAQILEQPPDANHVDGALDCVYKACEELNGRLDEQVQGMPEGSAAGLLISRLLPLMANPDVGIRRTALGSVNLMVPSWPNTHAAAMDTYLQGLFQLANDGDNGVRKHVCSGIVSLLYRAPEKLVPNIRDVITYMIEMTNFGDEDVALESCEFWAAFCEADLDRDTVEVLREFTPKLIPMLLTNMAYAEDDEEVLNAEDDEANAGRADRDQDIKPSFRGQKDKGSGLGEGAGGEQGRDGGDDDEYYDDDDDEAAQWNLRKSSANGLDVMSNLFGDDLLPMILPVVEQRLRDANWRLRESAILALGAVAEGCSGGLAQYVPQLIEFLVPSLDDARPMVRSIACWTLSRFSRWVVQMTFAPHPGDPAPPTAEQGKGFVNNILGGLLRRVVDHNKHVQAAACGALATFTQEIGEDVAPWLGPTVQALAQAIATYQRKNMRSVYDAVATLCESAGECVRTADVARALLPPLLQKWEAGGDAQPDLYNLLECVTSVVMGVGLGAQEYAAPMFARALQLARHQLALREQAKANPDSDVPYEPDHVVAALDLLSGVADGLGAACEALIAANAPALREVIVASVSDPYSPGIRRSAFALVGDVAKSGAGSHVAPSLPQIFECAAANLQPKMVQAYNMSVCNNACWSAGEIALAFPPETVAPYVPALCGAFVQVLNMTMINRSLGENAAIALGRFAARCPEQLASGFGELCGPWCGALRRLRDGQEKEQAFAGLVRLVQLNPQGAVGDQMVSMMNAIASWQFVRDQTLHANLLQLMQGYEQMLGAEQWAQLANALGPAVQRKLGNFASINQKR